LVCQPRSGNHAAYLTNKVSRSKFVTFKGDYFIEASS